MSTIGTETLSSRPRFDPRIGTRPSSPRAARILSECHGSFRPGPRRGEVSVLLGPWRPSEEVAYPLFGGLPLVQDFVDLFGDRHRHAQLPSEVEGRARREDPFGHHLHLAENVAERSAPAELDADAPVPRERPGAGEDEIAEPGQPGERLLPPAERQGE